MTYDELMACKIEQELIYLDQISNLMRERDEARSLVLRIGFRLRQWVVEEERGWAPSAIAEVYQMIDEWSWVKGDG